MGSTLAFLSAERVDLDRHAALVEELGEAIDTLLLAATELAACLTWPRPPALQSVRLCAPLYPEGGLPGLLQAALLAGPGPELIALDAAAPSPPASLVRRLLEDRRPGSALVCQDGEGKLGLPGRFRRGYLGPLARALREGERELGPILRQLRASRLEVTP